MSAPPMVRATARSPRCNSSGTLMPRGRTMIGRIMDRLNVVAAFAAVILALASLPNSSVAQSLKEQLVGTWAVVSVVNERDGNKVEPFGPKPVGYFMFAPTGHRS